jgi:hypothetical protein
MSLYPDTNPREQLDPLGRDRDDEEPKSWVYQDAYDITYLHLPKVEKIAIRPVVADVPEWKKEDEDCPF